MADLKNNIINTNIAGNTSNILVPDIAAIASGIEFKSNIDSNVLNGYYNSLSEAVQYLQFTGGLYDENADYDEGNIASLVIKNGTDYSIWQFRRNANNPRVLNNNPPISGASITTVNGVDAYEGGTLNTDWDKLTEDYAIEATANTVMGRDSEGASNVNMPSSITNTSIVNNEYLQQELQAGLATKQDTLTAGTNITIEDNVISASGDLATKAELVSYDNTNTNLEYISGYDFPKFKTPIADTINLVLASSTSASITKQEDGSYLLQSSLNNIPPMLDMIFIPITSIEDQTKRFGISNILLQFFDNITMIFGSDFSNVNYTALETEECSISEIDSPLEFAIVDVSSSVFIIIKRQDNTPIPQANYSINLNIKNRVLRNQDSNLFSFINLSTTKNAEYDFLSLEANGSSVIIKGTITNLPAGTATGFYIINNIIPNYFTLNGGYISTSGITSSSGKSVQYKVVSTSLNTETIYNFALQYTDGSQIQSSDVFTFNLTPDKNSTLNPIYQNVANVQDAIESIVLNKIMPIGSTYIQFAEDDGTFDASKSPEKLFGGTWQLKYNTESVFFRTEGSLSEEGRSNGIQGDAIRNIAGTIQIMTANLAAPTGVFDYTWGFDKLFTFTAIETQDGWRHANTNFRASNVVPTSTENRTKNRKIRIYKRIA